MTIERSVLLCVLAAVTVLSFSGLALVNNCEESPDLSILLESAAETNGVVQLNHSSYCLKSFVMITDKTNLTIQRAPDFADDVTIYCPEGSEIGMAFFNISELHFSNFTIDGCHLTNNSLSWAMNKTKEDIDIYYVIDNHTKIAVFIAGSSGIDISQVNVINTPGIGLFILNPYDECTLENMVFTNNSGSFVNISYNTTNPDGRHLGGGAIIQFHNWKRPRVVNVSFQVKNCKFHNSSSYGGSEAYKIYGSYSEALRYEDIHMATAGGLSIKLCQSNYSANVNVIDCDFFGNGGLEGGGAQVIHYRHTFISNIIFNSCTFRNSTNPLQLTSGGGLYILSNLLYMNYEGYSGNETLHILVEKCNFTSNYASSGGGAQLISPLGAYIPSNSTKLEFVDCNFVNNTASYGAALLLYTSQQDGLQAGVLFYITNSHFVSNSQGKDSSISLVGKLGSGIIYGLYAQIYFNNVTIEQSYGSGLVLEKSVAFISGSVTIKENSAVYGGAILFNGLSFLVMQNHSNLSILSNQAVRNGGGFFYSESASTLSNYNQYDCFLLFNNLDLYCTSCGFEGLDFTITFAENVASLGDMIYGSLLDVCSWGYGLKEPYGPGGFGGKPHTIEVLENYTEYFHFQRKSNTRINTSPGNLVVTPSVAKVMPGEAFGVSGMAFDRLDQGVFDILTALVSTACFNKGQACYKASVGDTGLWLLNADNSSLSFAKLTGSYEYNESSHVQVQFTSVYTIQSVPITVELQPCYSGFQYSNVTSQCECYKEFEGREEYIICNVTSGSISVNGEYWFGMIDNSNVLSHDVSKYVLKHCVNFYCFAESNVKEVINVTDLSAQCDQNRAGFMCGKCRPGYTLLLGSDACGVCNDDSGIAFLVLFAGLGILLLVFICLLHFHVSKGYINGLIFYSNIIVILYERLGFCNSLLLVVFQWISLQWGISTCFLKNMDALTQTWLEFVFPLYIAFLMILISLFLKYVPIPEKFRNEISPPLMFTTLLLLSFNTLMLTSIRVLGFTAVTTFTGEQSIRWLYDPSIEYFAGGHAPLVLFSCLVLLFMLFCTVITLLPCKYIPNKWLKTVKPFLDSLHAPFKEHYILKSWESWRLIIRGLCFVVVNFVSPDDQPWILLVIILIFLFVQLFLKPYKQIVLDFADSLLLLVLIFTLLLIAFVGSTSQLNDYEFETLYPILQVPVYLIMLLVVIAHVYKRLECQIRRCVRSTPLYKPFVKTFGENTKCSINVQGDQNSESEESEGPAGGRPTLSTLGLSDSINDPEIADYESVREPLLFTDSSDEMRNISK